MRFYKIKWFAPKYVIEAAELEPEPPFEVQTVLSTSPACIGGASGDLSHAGAGEEGFLGTGQKQPHREDEAEPPFKAAQRDPLSPPSCP